MLLQSKDWNIIQYIYCMSYFIILVNESKIKCTNTVKSCYFHSLSKTGKDYFYTVSKTRWKGHIFSTVSKTRWKWDGGNFSESVEIWAYTVKNFHPFVGSELKPRVNRWKSKILEKIKTKNLLHHHRPFKLLWCCAKLDNIIVFSNFTRQMDIRLFYLTL